MGIISSSSRSSGSRKSSSKTSNSKFSSSRSSGSRKSSSKASNSRSSGTKSSGTKSSGSKLSDSKSSDSRSSGLISSGLSKCQPPNNDGSDHNQDPPKNLPPKKLINDETVREKIMKGMKQYETEEDIENFKEDFYNLYGFHYDIDELVDILSNPKSFKKRFFSEQSNKEILAHIDKMISEVKFPEEYTDKEKKVYLEKVKNASQKLINDNNLKFLLKPIDAAKNSFYNVFITLYIKAKGKKHFPFGQMHSALSVGGRIIEWGNNFLNDELIIPTTNYNQIFNISFDIDESFFTKIKNFLKDMFANFINFFVSIFQTECDKEINKIVEKCVEYNTHFFYDETKRNCQKFVFDVLRELNIDLKFEGEMEREYNYILKNLKLDFKYKEKTFNTRKELDEFVKKCNFQSLCQDDKKLLFMYKSSFEIAKKCGEEEGLSDTELEKYETTEESEKMWKDFKVSELLSS